MSLGIAIVIVPPGGFPTWIVPNGSDVYDQLRSRLFSSKLVDRCYASSRVACEEETLDRKQTVLVPGDRFQFRIRGQWSQVFRFTREKIRLDR